MRSPVKNSPGPKKGATHFEPIESMGNAQIAKNSPFVEVIEHPLCHPVHIFLQIENSRPENHPSGAMQRATLSNNTALQKKSSASAAP
jgi:hypothetical protein